MSEHAREVEIGDRFEFGANWQNFLNQLSEERISEAENSLKEMLGIVTLVGLSFLDIGSGSGLFSLAARRLGAKVVSFDFDPKSVSCTTELKRRYFPNDADWRVEEGSALDAEYLRKLGKFDVVYSWGVLHHTGSMWRALSNVDLNVKSGGKLFVALYNDQGRASVIWAKIKKTYVGSPAFFRPIILFACMIKLWGPASLRDLLLLRPFVTWREYKKSRGMSPWVDVIDWVGGYPFEVSKPEEVFDLYQRKGYSLYKLTTCTGGHGCNQYVFENSAE